MTTQTVEKTATKQPSDFEQKVQKLREIYADAGDISKAALENVIRALSPEASATASAKEKMESAGRIGARQGKVSELTVILPLKPGGAKRMRAFLEPCTATSAIKAWNWLAPFTTCAGSSWITTRRCSSPALTTATGIPTSMTSAPRSQTSSTSSSVKSKVGRGFVAQK